MKILKSIMNVYVKAFKKKSNMISLIRFLRDDLNVDIGQISTLKFSMRFINMVVMFLPIKVFLVLSSGQPIGFLSFTEPYLGVYHSEIILLSLTVLLYIFNLIINIYSSRLVNKQENKISRKSYNISCLNVELTKKNMVRCLSHVYNWLSGAMLISVAIALFFIGSWHFSLFFSSLLLLYTAFVEYFFFTENKFSFLDKVKLTRSQVLQISTAIFYLISFFLIFYTYLQFGIQIHFAILMLFLVRLTNGCLKTYFMASFSVGELLKNNQLPKK